MTGRHIIAGCMLQFQGSYVLDMFVCMSVYVFIFAITPETNECMFMNFFMLVGSHQKVK